MGIKYRASMSKRDYKKLDVIELDDDTDSIYVCDEITIIPMKCCRYCLFDYIDIVLHSYDKEPIRLRCGMDGLWINCNVCVDVEHKTKYAGLFPTANTYVERFMVRCDGNRVTVDVIGSTNDDKTV